MKIQFGHSNPYHQPARLVESTRQELESLAIQARHDPFRKGLVRALNGLYNMTVQTHAVQEAVGRKPLTFDVEF